MVSFVFVGKSKVRIRTKTKQHVSLMQTLTCLPTSWTCPLWNITQFRVVLLSANLRWRWQFSKNRWCHCNRSQTVPQTRFQGKCEMNRVSHCFSNFKVGISPSWVLTWDNNSTLSLPMVFWLFLVYWGAWWSLVPWTAAWSFLFLTTIIWDIKFFHDGNQYNLCFFWFQENFRVGWGVWCTVNRLIKNSQAVRSKVFYTSTLIWRIFWKCGVLLLGYRCKCFDKTTWLHRDTM